MREPQKKKRKPGESSHAIFQWCWAARNQCVTAESIQKLANIRSATSSIFGKKQLLWCMKRCTILTGVRLVLGIKRRRFLKSKRNCEPVEIVPWSSPLGSSTLNQSWYSAKTCNGDSFTLKVRVYYCRTTVVCLNKTIEINVQEMWLSLLHHVCGCMNGHRVAPVRSRGQCHGRGRAAEAHHSEEVWCLPGAQIFLLWS